MEPSHTGFSYCHPPGQTLRHLTLSISLSLQQRLVIEECRTLMVSYFHCNCPNKRSVAYTCFFSTYLLSAYYVLSPGWRKGMFIVSVVSAAVEQQQDGETTICQLIQLSVSELKDRAQSQYWGETRMNLEFSYIYYRENLILQKLKKEGNCYNCQKSIRSVI